MKIINEEDIRKANNIEKCELLISIIKRTSNIYVAILIFYNTWFYIIFLNIEFNYFYFFICHGYKISTTISTLRAFIIYRIILHLNFILIKVLRFIVTRKTALPSKGRYCIINKMSWPTYYTFHNYLSLPWLIIVIRSTISILLFIVPTIICPLTPII